MKRFTWALLARLFFSFLLTAIVTTGFVFMLMKSFRPEGGLHSVVEKNIDFYLTSLHNSISPNITAEKVKALYDKLGIQVVIDSGDSSLKDPALPLLSDLKPEIEELAPRFTLGKEKGYFYAIHEGLTPRIAWIVKSRDLPKGFQMTFVGILAFLFAIFAMSFISVHILMRPLRVMLHGVEQIATGNLRYRMPNRYGRRGFAPLVERFNHIGDQFERMILSKDRLLRDVSHELRSPLTRMNVAIDLLDNSKLKTSLKKDAQIMNRLIHDLLESYRVQKTQTAMKNLNIANLIESLRSLYQSTETDITVKGPADLSWPLDVTLMEVVLKNLIENSIKYVNQNPVRIQINYRKDADRLTIEFRDNGPGIAANDLPYIFEPFYRSSIVRDQTTPDGFGLGLSIVKTYTELQNGQVSAKNTPEDGIKFTLEFQL